MLRVEAGIEHRDLDWTIWPNASVNLQRSREVNLLRRPLRHVRTCITTDTPRIADAPRVAATNWWLGNVVRLNKDDARIMRQHVDAICDGATIG